jgi:hypothetical protein
VADFIPAAKCVRLVESVADEDGHTATVRFYLTYAGTAPLTADLVVLAAACDAQYTTDIMALTHSSWTSAGCVATDLTTITSAQGTSSTPTAGSLTGGHLPASASVVVSQETTRRLRGGHSRIYVPCGDTTKLLNDGQWTAFFSAEIAAAWQDVVGTTAAAAWAGAGTITAVLASFYSGFTNVAYGTPLKYRRVPTPRGTAAFYDVVNYVGKQGIGSQRKRLRAG